MDSTHNRRPLSQYILLIGSFESVGLGATNEVVNFIKRENPEFELTPPRGPKGQKNSAWVGEHCQIFWLIKPCLVELCNIRRAWAHVSELRP